MKSIPIEQIRELFYEVINSSDAEDWKRLKLADKKIHSLLLTLRQESNLDPAVKRTLMKLKNAHTLAHRKALSAAQKMQHQINEQSQEIERARAYVNVLDLASAKQRHQTSGLME